MPSVVRTLVGKGTFDLDFGLRVAAEFTVTVRSDAWVEVIFSVPVSQQTERIIDRSIDKRRRLVQAKLHGLISSPANGRIVANRLVVSGLSFRATPERASITLRMVACENVIIEFFDLQSNARVEIRHGLTNFVFQGCLTSPTPTGWSRDKFSAVLEDLEVTYKHFADYRHIVRRLEHDIVVTSEAIVHTRLSEHERASNTVEDSLVLLSFASGSYIASIYEDLYKGGALARTILKPVKTMAYHGHDPCIDVRNLSACDLQEFLETVFPRYRSLKEELGVDIVIEYYLQAKLAQLPEIKYLLGIVAIECLLSHARSYFARIDGRESRPWSLRCLVQKMLRRHQRKNLRERMLTLLDHLAIPYMKNDLTFIKMRGSLVHAGRFPRSVQSIVACDALIHFLDRVLLRILGYEGKYYLNRVNAFQRELLP